MRCEEGFQGRPDLRGLTDATWQDSDERVASLHYRDVLEYAVGHGVSAELVNDDDPRAVRTCWVPSAEVERVDHVNPTDLDFGMDTLAALSNAAEASEKLMPLVISYRRWIEEQDAWMGGAGLTRSQRETAEDLIRNARVAADRIEQGIGLLAEAEVLDAFKIANRAMARAARQRRPNETPKWRAFQLAFLLMNVKGIDQPGSTDRDIVDLLFFPTGGGKTEAYLGLAAFTLVLRRLRNAGIASCGVSIIMRYTLRLLTLDQLGRAAALMCALELERADDARLGGWPFEIGLWVGSAATPNRMGYAGDKTPGADKTAYARTTRFKNKSAKYSAPIPIESCPWCGTKFSPDSWNLVPEGSSQPTDLRVSCANDACEFSGARNMTLPIVGVDEPIYRRLPCFLIATVDKFAALPWIGRVGCLFGHVDRYDSEGFYGPCDPNRGKKLPGGRFLPPDLIVQDELHLISGPLGTIAGIYEVAIEQLCCRRTRGRKGAPTKDRDLHGNSAPSWTADSCAVRSNADGGLSSARPEQARFVFRPHHPSSAGDSWTSIPWRSGARPKHEGVAPASRAGAPLIGTDAPKSKRRANSRKSCRPLYDAFRVLQQLEGARWKPPNCRGRDQNRARALLAAAADRARRSPLFFALHSIRTA